MMWEARHETPCDMTGVPKPCEITSFGWTKLSASRRKAQGPSPGLRVSTGRPGRPAPPASKRALLLQPILHASSHCSRLDNGAHKMPPESSDYHTQSPRAWRQHPQAAPQRIALLLFGLFTQVGAFAPASLNELNAEKGKCLQEASSGACPTVQASHGAMNTWDVSKVTSLYSSESRLLFECCGVVFLALTLLSLSLSLFSFHSVLECQRFQPAPCGLGCVFSVDACFE